MGIDGRETTVVVGEYKAVGADHYTRAEAAKIDDIVAQSIGSAIELVLRKLKTLGAHLLINGFGKVVERPHTFVSFGLRAHNKHRGSKQN